MKSTFPLALLTTAFLTTLGQAATIVGTGKGVRKRFVALLDFLGPKAQRKRFSVVGWNKIG